MESQCFAYGMNNGAALSYSRCSNPPARIIASLPFDSRKSPLYNDHEFLSEYSDHNYPEPTFSSLDYTTYFQQSGPSPFCSQDRKLLLQNDDGNRRIQQVLQELETSLMAVDEDEEAIMSELFLRETLASQTHGPSSTTLSSNNGAIADFGSSSPRSDLKELLIGCAEALSENRLGEFERLVEHTRGAVSITGEPIQRLGAYMLEGLIARKESSGARIYRSWKCNEPDSKDLLSYMHNMYQMCPYLKFSFMAANGAIAEACNNEDRIHIIDFQIRQGTQWLTLLQALAERPSGPPKVRITGVDDPISRYARGASLAAVGEGFAAISKKFNISIEFHPIPVFAPNVTKEMLDIRPNEALAVNFPLQLHHTPDESVDVSNPRDGLLRMVKSLSPKVVTLIEQESNTNTAPFLPRFVETFDYYLAIFELLDVAKPRDQKERIDVEQHCLARDIVSLIACEGKDRVERHEVIGKWRLRFMMAGFKQCTLSPYVKAVIRGLLKSYSEHYSLVEKDGAMLLGWKNTNLISASAWH